MLVNLVFVVAFYKELKLATFDAALAASLGVSPVLVHYLLMGAVSVTTVASFEAIGAILVVAFLIVPAAAAHLLTDRLWLMLVLSAAIGILSAVAGYFAATALDVSVSGMMAAAMGGFFVLAWLFAPREGVIGRLVARRRARERFALALVLARLARAPADEQALLADLAWPRERLSGVLAELRRNGLVEAAGAALTPTPMGLGFLSATAR
jgi:manganese/zinc/iron transport system permease protein